MLTNKLYETADHYIRMIRANRPNFALDRGNKLCIMITETQMVTGVSGIRITDSRFELLAAEWNAVLALLESDDTRVLQMVIVSFDDLRIKMPCRDCVEQLLDLNEDNASCEVLVDPNTSLALGKYAEIMPEEDEEDYPSPYPSPQPYPYSPPYPQNPYQQPYSQSPYPQPYAPQPQAYPQQAPAYVDYNSAAPYTQKPYVMSSQYAGSPQAMAANDSLLKKKLAKLFDSDEIEDEEETKAAKETKEPKEKKPAEETPKQPAPMSPKELKKMAKEQKKLMKQQRSK